MNIITIGSICSGIEAASVAWKGFKLKFKWFSEIADFPSRLLAEKYPSIPNLGDINDIPNKILNKVVDAPDLICGGTPCQAFSLAGLKKGLSDNRGNLSLKFVEIVEANDLIRKREGKHPSIVFWENVEGVLTDKTNAFGCLVSSLAGFDYVIQNKKWSAAGLIRGPKRNVVWRVLDAKFFGVPQQRRRLYLIATDKHISPENMLFEIHTNVLKDFPKSSLVFNKENSNFEIFRSYTDCLYSAYGTKWNGNAAAYNGSLYVVQNEKIRRLSPLECERLMGFPDGYTDIINASKTNRYQAIGNSWVVPVIKWVGKKIFSYQSDILHLDDTYPDIFLKIKDGEMFCFKSGIIRLKNIELNCSEKPENIKIKTLDSIISSIAPEDIYISPVGCYGIYRRKEERKLKINRRLEEILLATASTMPLDEIEKRSLIQKRSDTYIFKSEENSKNTGQLAFFPL